MPTYFVRDIMSAPALTIHYEADLDEAAAMLESNQIRRLPVLDDEGQLVGILTQGDVRVASMATAVDPYDAAATTWLTAGDAMTHRTFTVTADTSVVDVVKMMLAHKIGGLPVVDDTGAVIGMVTETDIFRLVVREWSEE
ncbi:MAG: CBS domain-containing protein [Anaerolineae bacterium]